MKAATLALAVATLPALAGSAGAEPTQQGVSVTTDGLELVGIFDATVEWKAAPHVGLGATAGAGRIMFDPKTSVWLAGADANYYLTNDFSGWRLGAMTKYVGANAGDQMNPLSGSGALFGAYGGYKLMTSGGFTGLVDVGVGGGNVMVADASRKIGATTLGLLFNLGIGFSF